MGTLAPVPGIRGRAAEIAVLGEAVDRLVSGRPAVVLIEGEAGIGKTRLLAGVLEDARGRGMQVAAGRAEELEQTRPFGLVAAAFGCVRASTNVGLEIARGSTPSARSRNSAIISWLRPVPRALWPTSRSISTAFSWEPRRPSP